MMRPSEIWNGKVVAGPNGCHIFTGTLINSGYGQINKVGSKHLAHRLIYTECFGPIPPGLQVNHRCNVRRCVNPLHLYAGTQKDNMRDKFASGYVVTDETRAKLRANQIGKQFSHEHLSRMRAVNVGKKMSDATKAKMRAAKLGKKLSADHKARMRVANLGKKMSESSRAKMRAAKIGKKLSDDHRAKLSAAITGRRFSEETRAKISSAQRATWVRRKNRNYSCGAK